MSLMNQRFHNSTQKTFERLKQIELELKIDLDEILDIMNEIKKTQETPNLPENVKKEVDKTFKLYENLFSQYSKLFNDNAEFMKKYSN